jgi:hypothetical protein
MLRKRKERLMKIVFLKFLENILLQKKMRIIESTVTDIRLHNLMDKGFRGMKRLWGKTSRYKLMKRVAKEFY